MKTSIEIKNNQAFLALNGRLYAPIALRSFRPQGDIIADFHQKGFRLFNIFPSGINCALANRTIPYSQFGKVWTGEGTYCWDRLRDQVDLFLENAPQGLFSLNVHLDAPDWYLQDHPECADSWDQLIQNAGYEPWRCSAARYLCDLIDKLEEWLPGRLYGVFLLAGGTTEWYTRNEAGFANPLPIQLEAYRKWCDDPQATIPALAELNETDDGCLRHPRKNSAALRYWRFVSDIVTDCIRYFAAVAKRHTHGQKLVGVFTGYIHGMPLPHVVKSSYNEFPAILRDPHIDCIFCPASYNFRRLCDTSAFRVPIDSYVLHKKVYFHEIDSTTHLTHDHPLAYLHNKNDGPFTSLRETAAYFRREVGMTLAKGQGYWWFDMFAGWYDDPETMIELEKLRCLSEQVMQLDKNPISEVCLVTDLESNYYLGTGPSFHDEPAPYPMAEAQAPALNRMGTPWDSILTDDLFNDAFCADRYKLFYFPNLFKVSARLLEKIEQLRAAGKHLLFAHAPGYIDDNGFSLQGMHALTGLQLEKADDACRTLTTTDGLSWDMPVSPRFCTRAADETWATFADGSSAFALRERTGAFDAFSAGVPIPQELLRKLAVRAGCFQYIDTFDPVYANSRLITVCCHRPGNRILRWPHKSRIRDAFNEVAYNIGPAGVSIPFGENETRIFIVEDQT